MLITRSVTKALALYRKSQMRAFYCNSEAADRQEKRYEQQWRELAFRELMG